MDYQQDQKNPLPISPHPGLVDESPLSSAPSSPTQWMELQDKSKTILAGYTPVSRLDDTQQLLGAFVKCLSKEGQVALMLEICQFSSQPPKLRALRNFLVDAILKPMKAAGRQLSIPITPSPNEGFIAGVQIKMTEVQPSSRSGQRALRDDCLVRDNYQCVISGLVDRDSFENLPPDLQKAEKRTTTQCSHIIPFALRKFDEKVAIQTENTATIWWALHRYFPFVAGKIDAESINQRQNAVMLSAAIHDEFGNFRISLTPLQGEHEYRVDILEASFTSTYLPTIIRLRSHSSIPMPDPDFFRLHSQVAQILKVSGIGERLEKAHIENMRIADNIPSDGSIDLEHILSQKMLIDI